MKSIIDENVLLSSIHSLDKIYHSSINSEDYKLPIYISKLAILESCGWIEETFDRLSDKYIEKLSDSPYSAKMKETVKNNNGFSYDNHFLKAHIIPIFGYSNLIAVESKIGEIKVNQLKQMLTLLKKSRDSLAHTYTNTTTRCDTPSVTLSTMNTIITILKNFETEFDSIKLDSSHSGHQ